ncbi:MAG: glycoside hydrolase family 28 protein [Bacteroidota bacterium]
MTSHAQTYDVRAFGAKGDGVSSDRSAIQRAVDSCSRTGGTVLFPSGTYLTGSIELKNNVDLYLQRGAVILGSTDLRDYTEFIPELRSYNDLFLKYSLFYAEGKNGISIRGEGTIDGQGAAFPVLTKVKPDRYMNRPYVIRFIQCSSVKIDGITMRNSAMWMQQYLACNDLTIRGITVYNHANMNNDMMDIDGCKNVIVSDCIGDTEDDALTLKSTSEYITENVSITNCVVSSHCNAIKTGTESTGGFRNITISNITVKPSANPVAKVGYPAGISGISLTNVDGGVLENITISNVTMDGPQVPIYIRLGNRARKHRPDAATPKVGTANGISISNIVAVNAGPIGSSISGIPGYCAENIRLEHISISCKGGGTKDDISKLVPESENEYPESTGWGKLPAYGFYLRHVRNITMTDVDVRCQSADLRPAIMSVDADGLMIKGLTAKASAGTSAMIIMDDTKNASVFSSRSQTSVKVFLRVTGERSEKIRLIGNDYSNTEKIFDASKPGIINVSGNKE